MATEPPPDATCRDMFLILTAEVPDEFENLPVNDLVTFFSHCIVIASVSQSRHFENKTKKTLPHFAFTDSPRFLCGFGLQWRRTEELPEKNIRRIKRGVAFLAPQIPVTDLTDNNGPQYQSPPPAYSALQPSTSHQDQPLQDSVLCPEQGSHTAIPTLETVTVVNRDINCGNNNSTINSANSVNNNIRRVPVSMSDALSQDQNVPSSSTETFTATNRNHSCNHSNDSAVHSRGGSSSTQASFPNGPSSNVDTDTTTSHDCMKTLFNYVRALEHANTVAMVSPCFPSRAVCCCSLLFLSLSIQEQEY